MRTGVALALFLGLFTLYAHQASPSVTAGDAGEFMATAATLSMAHPPAYPLYSLAARAFATLVPFGDFSYRTNIFSAFLSSAALMMLFLILTELGLSLSLGAFASVAVGFGLSFWTNALVTEVFPLNSFLAALIFFFAARGTKNILFLDAGFLILGVGLGNHQTLLVMGPVLLWVAFRRYGGPMWVRRMPIWAGVFLLGFCVNLYIPLRAAKSPPLNWGQATTVSRVIRILSRKDYGSFTLALGETPARNVVNTQTQLVRFTRQLNHELPWPLVLLALGGLALALRRRETWAEAALGGFLLTGPIFFLLSNMPFTGQSVGVMGRFFILPAMFLSIGLAGYQDRARWVLTSLVLLSLLMLLGQNIVEASGSRDDYLVADYGRSMLRTLPRGAAFFMEGGDDAFYSLAYLHEAKGLRPDLELHDRGGLIYPNPYGDDFRQLTREEKVPRRLAVEQRYLSVRPLFYSTLDTEVLPNVPLVPVGFLMEAGHSSAPRLRWPLLILRSLYPTAVQNYRTRALAAFFPYFQGRTLINEGKIAEGLDLWRACARIGFDVDWTRGNLPYEYAHRAYDALQNNKPELAEIFYRQWIEMSPQSYEARSNLGVALERQRKFEQAIQENDLTAQLFPTEADPLYNNAVALWPTKDWPRIARYLQQALARNPRHKLAAEAMQRIPRTSGT